MIASTSTPAAGGRSRPRLAGSESTPRPAALGATITCVLQQEGLDHYAVGMKDPEGNEFDIN
jgi:hypothetical protein